LKIGDVARRVGVSPSVIRSWESLGLTRPRRTKSKYRLYTAEDVTLLKRARFLRRVRGLNAPAIVELLKREGLVRPSPDGAAEQSARDCVNCESGADCLWRTWRKQPESRWVSSARSSVRR